MGQVARGLLATVQNAVPAPGSSPSPSVPAAPTISGLSYVGATLSSGGQADQWYRDGSPIAGATSDTYTVQSADSGASITATVGTSGPSNALVMNRFTDMVSIFLPDVFTEDTDGTAINWPSAVSGGGTPAAPLAADQPRRIDDPMAGGQFVMAFDGAHELVDSSPPANVTACFASNASFTMGLKYWSYDGSNSQPYSFGDDTQEVRFSPIYVGADDEFYIRIVFNGAVFNGTERWVRESYARLVMSYDGSTGALKVYVNGVLDIDSTVGAPNRFGALSNPYFRIRSQIDACYAWCGLWSGALDATAEAEIAAWDEQVYADQMPADIWTRDHVYVGVPAQSNGEHMGTWNPNTVDAPPLLLRFKNDAHGGRPLSEFTQGDAAGYFSDAETWITALPNGTDVWIYNVHGEADALTPALSAVYETEYGGLIDDLRAACPNQNLYFLCFLVNPTFDDARGGVGTAEVRAAQEAVAAAKTGVYTIEADHYDLAAHDDTHYEHPVVDCIRRQMELRRYNLQTAILAA